MPPRYTYLGPEGTFAEQALRTLPEVADRVVTPARSVPEALDAVRAREADAALVPLENSVGGAVAVTLDELASGAPLMVVREVVLPVQFVLGAKCSIQLYRVATVSSHPQAAAQSRNWLRKNA